MLQLGRKLVKYGVFTTVISRTLLQNRKSLCSGYITPNHVKKFRKCKLTEIAESADKNKNKQRF